MYTVQSLFSTRSTVLVPTLVDQGWWYYGTSYFTHITRWSVIEEYNSRKNLRYCRQLLLIKQETESTYKTTLDEVNRIERSYQ